MRHLVGYSLNTIPVHVDLINSGAAKHIAKQPSLLTMAAKALAQTEISHDNLELEYDMGRTIGYDFVVDALDESAAVFYARLVRDGVYTRFTHKGNPKTTSHLTIILQPSSGEEGFDVHDMWIGPLRPPKPGSDNEASTSREYWKSHAVVFENQPLHPRTLTKDCPY